MASSLFEGVTFTAVPSEHLWGEQLEKVIDDLVLHGAVHKPITGNNTIASLTDVTHIISSTPNFPEYEDAVDSYIHVVKPTWVEQSLRKKKQSNPRQFSPNPRLFMTDFIVCCVGIPEGDKEAIAGGVLAMGGQYSETLSKLVTHLVTLDDSNDACRVAIEKNLKCKILLPHWFDDCLRLGRRISETPYTFPDPEILNNELDSPPTARNNDEIEGAIMPTPNLDLEELESVGQHRPLNVLRGKYIMLGTDLQLGANLRSVITDIITKSNGNVVDTIHDADIYVGQYRAGTDYVSASQKGAIVGNLAWLYHLITHDRWLSPLSKLLHYPVPKDGIPEFAGTLISISNYTGSARLYLQHLVKALGGKFSGMMRQENTHLVVAHEGGEKCDAAKQWNINIVNHLWLEESYARCKMQSVTNRRYLEFPSRTNLGEIIGQTPLDREVIAKLYYSQQSPTPSSSKLGQKQRESVKIRKSTPVHHSRSAASVRSETDRTPEHRDEDILQEVENMDVDESTPTAMQRRKRGAVTGTDQTPASRRMMQVGKENETPGSTGSRGAKEKAISRLHDSAADIALYEKERKRAGGVTHGRFRGERVEEAAVNSSKKRKSSETEERSESEDSVIETEENALKKARKNKNEKLPPIKQRVVITTWQRWLDNPSLEQLDKAKLRNLGLHVSEDASGVNILCAPRIVKTKKFVCALANGPHVVSTDFLESCLKNNKLADVHKFSLKDPEAETKLRFNLLRSLARAEANNHHLLRGWQIFCTERISGGFATYNEIIRANGGTCMLWKGRFNSLAVTKRTFDGDDPAAESQNDDTGDTLYLISGQSKQEQELWPAFRQLAGKADMKPVVARAEWILAVTMGQEFKWEDQWELGK